MIFSVISIKGVEFCGMPFMSLLQVTATGALDKMSVHSGNSSVKKTSIPRWVMATVHEKTHVRNFIFSKIID